MIEVTYEDGEREGFYAGYKDGKRGKDYFNHTQCQAGKGAEYEKGWKAEYEKGFKLGQRIKKHTS